MSRSFWQGRRVFITGHTGFKGSWLSLMLQTLGANVSGFSLPPSSTPNLFQLSNVPEGIRSEFGDVRDLEALRAIIDETSPEVVFHLAAQPLVRYSYADPIETYTTNVIGTVNLLQAVRAAKGLMAVVVVTSDKCYENPETGRPFTESDPLGGFDPYSSSKGCAELVTSAMRRSFFADGGAAIATARAGNVIGGGDWSEDRLVPDLIRASVSGIPARIRNPRAVRPWQHVLEPLYGYLRIAEELCARGQEFSGAWNLGPDGNHTQSVDWLCKSAAAYWPDKEIWIPDDSRQPHEAQLLSLDSTKAKNKLGWECKLTEDQTTAWTFEWYRDLESGVDARQLTINQIQRYLDMTSTGGNFGG